MLQERRMSYRLAEALSPSARPEVVLPWWFGFGVWGASHISAPGRAERQPIKLTSASWGGGYSERRSIRASTRHTWRTICCLVDCGTSALIFHHRLIEALDRGRGIGPWWQALTHSSLPDRVTIIPIHAHLLPIHRSAASPPLYPGFRRASSASYVSLI